MSQDGFFLFVFWAFKTETALPAPSEISPRPADPGWHHRERDKGDSDARKGSSVRGTPQVAKEGTAVKE